ncbi:MAG TPA: glycoside hydrolase family 3 N-terminal domain-containing protein [Baekduia sp.]|nr:glycoside hydrolase family 3 N-terminal domain-containing protein [Baekduia sp.]
MRRTPAVVIVVVAALLAFGALTVLRSRGGATPPSPVVASSPDIKACKLGNGVTLHVSGGARCPDSAPPVAEPKTQPDAPAQAKAKTPPATAVHQPTKSAGAPMESKSSPPSMERLVGARIMTAMNGTAPSASLLARARAGQIGGVILFGANVSPRLSATVAALQSAAARGGNPRLLIAIDQEGGPIRRLPGAAPVLAPAQMATGAARSQGAATAAALRQRGINTDLAPVADVLGPGGFLGSRSFGSAPQHVATGACQFADGLQGAGVNATFKHFPGLGKAILNTDAHAVRIGASSAALLDDLAAYRACHPALVMLSNAVYPALDPQAPAVLSSKIIQDLLRGRLHFTGVTISDTLAAPGVASPTTALRAAKAGVDILLYTDEAISARAYSELLSAVRAGQLSRGALTASARRIQRLPRL